MQISNYFNKEEKKAPNERKWHSYTENLITCSDCKNGCTEYEKEEKQPKRKTNISKYRNGAWISKNSAGRSTPIMS